MKLPKKDADRFISTYFRMLSCANRDPKILPDPLVIGSQEHFIGMAKLRKRIFENPHLIEAYMEENPDRLPAKDLSLISSWKMHMLKDRFAIVRHLKSYSILLSLSEPHRCYGVIGINDPISKMVGPNLPIVMDAVLLPYEGRIIIDGLLAVIPLRIDARNKRMFEEIYQEAKGQTGLITSLPATAPVPETAAEGASD